MGDDKYGPPFIFKLREGDVMPQGRNSIFMKASSGKVFALAYVHSFENGYYEINKLVPVIDDEIKDKERPKLEAFRAKVIAERSHSWSRKKFMKKVKQMRSVVERIRNKLGSNL